MKTLFKNFNWVMFVSMTVLIVIGTVAIRSSGAARAETIFHGIWVGNVTTAVFGMMAYFALAAIDYRKLLDVTAMPAYMLAVVLLVAVLVFGVTVYGGKRWLWFFQPSEISKLCVICMVAEVFGHKRKDEDGDGFRWGFRGFLLAAAIIGVPCALILAEPDLGTTLTLVPATLVMLFVAGVWRKGLAVMVSVALVMAVTVLALVYEAERPGTSSERREKILGFVPLHEHQIKRVKVFLFPESDLTGSGYNLRQAKISIGSGGFSGKGVGKGETNHLKYLPQAISMNDFIFCVYAEETGFVGSLVLLCLFGLLLVSGGWVAYVSVDERGRMLALGMTTLVFAHVYVNIAMAIGLVPITGLPLPFVSAGKTFLLTVMFGLGIVQSVSIHREEIN